MMIFDRNENKQVVALLGAGSMGTAIVRRIGAGKKILLGDISEEALERVGEDFRRCGYDVETIQVNALQKESVEAFARKATELGPVMYFIDTAGASPNQAKPEHIVDLDMVGTGYAVDAFGEVMAEGGTGLIISSQAAYMYPIPNDIELQLVNTPTEELKDLKFIQKAIELNCDVLYSFHMASTEEFLIKYYNDNNLEITHIFRYKFPIPKIYDFHTKEKQDVDVIAIRAELK